MRCQACDDTATCHVTDLVGGKLVEYHVCARHAVDLGALQGIEVQAPLTPDPEVLQAWADPIARQKIAAYMLPALCLAMMDESAKVRLLAAYSAAQLGSDAESAIGALRDLLRDPDERVRKVAQFAIEQIAPKEAHERQDRKTTS
jgi:HEAT repeat protein